MKRKDAMPLSAILDEILQQNNLDIGLDAARARQAWKEAMGEAVDKCTTSIQFSKGVLYIHLSSSVLRNELFMNRRQLIDRLNSHIGRKIIQNIHFK